MWSGPFRVSSGTALSFGKHVNNDELPFFGVRCRFCRFFRWVLILKWVTTSTWIQIRDTSRSGWRQNFGSSLRHWHDNNTCVFLSCQWRRLHLLVKCLSINKSLGQSCWNNTLLSLIIKITTNSSTLDQCAYYCCHEYHLLLLWWSLSWLLFNFIVETLIINISLHIISVTDAESYPGTIPHLPGSVGGAQADRARGSGAEWMRQRMETAGRILLQVRGGRRDLRHGTTSLP